MMVRCDGKQQQEALHVVLPVYWLGQDKGYKLTSLVAMWGQCDACDDDI